MTPSPSLSSRRATRVRPPEFTAAVLRLPGGSCTKGELQIISVTGGLLGLPRPLNQGAKVSLMFMTLGGPVRGMAEMLKPHTWQEQPFRFVSLHENDERRLKALIQPAAKIPHAPARQIARAGVAPAMAKPAVAEPASRPALQTLGLSQPGEAPQPQASRPPDQDQQWIQKYRAALERNEQRKPLLQTVFGHFQRRSV